jgi:hypothetical protein
MARLGDNPTKNPLTGNEGLAATDPSTGDDVSFTPLILATFCAQNIPLANGTSNGMIDGASYAKLLALDTQAETNTRVSQLAEVAIPIFISSPSNGFAAIYQHVCDVPWVLAFDQLYVSAGSTNVTVNKNGNAIAGLTSNPATTVANKYTGSDSAANMTLNQGDILGITLAGTTGNCANLYASIRANATISS